MHCRHYEKQTRGGTTEVELDGLTCLQADHCRRKGICVLSPFSKLELAQGVKETAGEPQAENIRDLETYFEVLRFRNALGFQWQRIDDFTEAVKAAGKYRERGQPKVVRRVEIFQLPD
ncbi:MAG: hypothetical protein FVQ81_05605 [Candidatus Glassbacteria bacterium]|nr:hypothetical protein [Candidatus Glassbacteria bacterium]